MLVIYTPSYHTLLSKVGTTLMSVSQLKTWSSTSFSDLLKATKLVGGTARHLLDARDCISHNLLLLVNLSKQLWQRAKIEK